MSQEALKFKDLGNTAFLAKKFEEAVQHFSDAIAHDPTNHVFYSNRSASFAELGKFEEALTDADKCLEINPKFAKGYSRKGLALFRLRKLDEAKKAYEDGLVLDPNNAQLKEGLTTVDRAIQQGSNPMSKLFDDSMWAKLATDPKTRGYLNDPEVVNKIKMLQQNPNMMGSFLQDPKMMNVLSVLLGIPMQTANFDEKDETSATMPTEKTHGETSTKASMHKEDETDEEEAEEVVVPQQSDEEKQAIIEKEKGNDAYKKRQFEEALAHYTKAHELDASEPTYLANRAAVHFEMKNFELAIADCVKAIDLGRGQSKYSKVVAKAYTRIGNAYMKLEDLDKAIEAFDKSLVEEYNDAVKNKRKQAQELKTKREAEAYLDADKSEEHKTKGNELFKAGKFAEAITEYSEALRRNPKNIAVYSNRAACYTKLMDWQKGLSDCEECLKIDSTFVKAYIRKAKIQHFLKQYHKALETYNKGLKLDPKCADLVQGRNETLSAISAQNMSGQVDPERQKEALKDPEVQAILRDPNMMNIINSMSRDPKAAQKAMQDPDIRTKIETLIAAGVLQTR